MHSTVQQANSQLTVCQDADRACLAQNTAKLAVVVRDNPNPATGGGGVAATTGFSGVNATPTPTPIPGSKGSQGSQGSTQHTTNSSNSLISSHVSRHTTTEFVATQLVASGHVVMVDLWSQSPGRRLPPMPDQRNRQPAGANVTASFDNWPGTGELPVPAQQLAPPATTTRSSGPIVRRPPAFRLPDAGLEDESVPLLNLVNVDLFNRWPSVSALPVPGQTVARPAPAQPAEEVAAPASVEAAAQPPDSGASDMNLILPGALGLLMAGLLAHRKTRATIVTGMATLRLFVLRLW